MMLAAAHLRQGMTVRCASSGAAFVLSSSTRWDRNGNTLLSFTRDAAPLDYDFLPVGRDIASLLGLTDRDLRSFRILPHGVLLEVQSL